jgi:hypothetical protein
LKVQANSMSSTRPHPRAPDAVLACSLSGAQRADRERWLERLRGQALDVTSRPDGLSVRFAPSDPLEAEARALATAEAQCCPFLCFEVDRGEDAIELMVSGPPEARPIIDAMFGDWR